VSLGLCRPLYSSITPDRRKSELDQNDQKPDATEKASSWKAKFAEKALTWTEVGAYDIRAFLRTVGLMTKGHYAPAGNFHLSVMFGPLIFESGIPGYEPRKTCIHPPHAMSVPLTTRIGSRAAFGYRLVYRQRSLAATTRNLKTTSLQWSPISIETESLKNLQLVATRDGYGEDPSLRL
jgi:hypothetical protein